MLGRKLILVAIGLMCTNISVAAEKAPSKPPISPRIPLRDRLPNQVSPRPPSLSVASSNNTRLQDISFLEKITSKLLEMTKQNCKTLLTQTKTAILTSGNNYPKPKNYRHSYKDSHYYEPLFKQIDESFNDVEKRANALVLKAKNPENEDDIKKTKDLTKVFEVIYGEIDLNIRKNCEKYTTLIKSEIQTQDESILMYNKKAEKPINLTDRLKGWVGLKKADKEHEENLNK